MPNQTRHKLEEAEYFLKMMKESFEDDRTFAYHLSAFLSAARSVTLYMQVQYSHQAEFGTWYGQQREAMSGDTELKFLNDARAESIHKNVARASASRVVSVAADLFLVSGNSMSSPEPEVTETPAQSPHVAPQTVRRFFPGLQNCDVVPFCERQLAKLTRMVTECEGLFP